MTQNQFWLLVAILRFAVAERLLWGEHQDFFVKEGILQPEVFDPEVHHDEDGCLEPGDTIYTLVPELRAFVDFQVIRKTSDANHE